MSSHTEIFAALQDAMVAYNAQPELSAELKKAKDERDFANLELDEAKTEINRLQAVIRDNVIVINARNETITNQNRDLSDLRDRNSMLDVALVEANARIRDLEAAKRDASVMIQLLEADKTSLEAKLEDAKGYGARLADMLKNFGQSIAKAVEVPEVTSDKPFPVADSMGLPVSAEPKVDITGDFGPGSELGSSMDMATTERMEPVSEVESEGPRATSFEPSPSAEPFHGWATAPIEPVKVSEPSTDHKPWWANV